MNDAVSIDTHKPARSEEFMDLATIFLVCGLILWDFIRERAQ